MQRLVRLLGVLSALFLVGVVADRFAAGYAGAHVEQRLAEHGFRAPDVTIRGFPFVTQVLNKEYGHVEVRARSVQLDAGDVQDLAATLRGVDVDSTTALREARVDTLRARAMVPYAEVERAAGVRGLRLEQAAAKDEVRLTGKAQVLGRTINAAARGRVEARGDYLRVVPTGFEVQGVDDLDDRLSALLEERFAFDYPIPGLPKGVTVRSVTPGSEGFVVELSGRDTVLEAP